MQLPVGSFQHALAEWVGDALNARWFDNGLDIFDEIAAGRAAAVLGIEMGKPWRSRTSSSHISSIASIAFKIGLKVAATLD